MFFLALLLGGCFGKPADVKDAPKPNIIVIVADDLGWKDVGYNESTYYETPNIDRLAQQGIVCSNGYAGASNCAPSRACLVTGRNTPYHGVYTVSPSDRGNKKTRKLIPIENTEFIEDSVYTIAEALKDAGYITGTFGKWHVSEDPKRDGFDVNFAGGPWGHPTSYFAPYGKPQNIEAPVDEYLTDRVTSEAIRFIESYKDKKFFLYLPFYAVHTPLQAKSEFIKKYTNKPGSEGQDNAIYAAMIASVDENIGLIMKKLSDLKLDKNTIVIFTSDNGGICNISSQSPLRAGKGSYYEGGIRVPLIFRWPGVLPAESKSDFPVSNLDFYPTLANLAGIKKGIDHLDGINVLPYLTKNAESFNRPLFWHFPIYLQAYSKGQDESRDPLFRTRPGTVMRYGNWKLHYYYEDKDVELYDLETDPGERNNLADKMPDKRDDLMKMMKNWLSTSGAKIPTEINNDYDAVFEAKTIADVKPEK